MRLIDADKLSADMYHEAFEKDSDMQKWDSGCWIRYKMFENVLKAQPVVQPYTTTHDSIPAKTGKNDGDGTSGDCISRQAAIEVLRNRWLKTRNYEGIGEDIAEECEIYLKTLPSVQPSDSKIENAIRVLQSKYNKALSQDYIRNPIAWALYQTWKEFDR